MPYQPLSVLQLPYPASPLRWCVWRSQTGLIRALTTGYTCTVFAELTDAVLPAHCHRTPFPHANTTGPGEGGNKGGGGERGEKERVLGSMMAEADRFYCERYTGYDARYLLFSRCTLHVVFIVWTAGPDRWRTVSHHICIFIYIHWGGAQEYGRERSNFAEHPPVLA